MKDRCFGPAPGGPGWIKCKYWIGDEAPTAMFSSITGALLGPVALLSRFSLVMVMVLDGASRERDAANGYGCSYVLNYTPLKTVFSVRSRNQLRQCFISLPLYIKQSVLGRLFKRFLLGLYQPGRDLLRISMTYFSECVVLNVSLIVSFPKLI